MTQFFTKYPKITYDIDGTGTNTRLIIDIIHRAKFIDIVKSNLVIFYPYHVKEGETPEIIAHKLYGSSQYYWVVLLSNNIMDLWRDWPLSYDQMQQYLIHRYGSVPTSQTTIDHHEDKFGNFIDLATYNNTFSQGSTIVYADQYAFRLNEEKKLITLPDPKYVTQIENELDQFFVVN
jgi:hypothetical protein